MARIKAKINDAAKTSQTWKYRHNEAMDNPRGFEVPIVRMLHFWEMYAERHGERYEAQIADDPLMGGHWADIAAGIRGLLNGDTGRLSCETLDSFILTTLEENGFTLDDDGNPVR